MARLRGRRSRTGLRCQTPWLVGICSASHVFLLGTVLDHTILKSGIGVPQAPWDCERRAVMTMILMMMMMMMMMIMMMLAPTPARRISAGCCQRP